MLIPLVPQGGEHDNVIKIKDAKAGKTFPWRLEYNCPVHEHWNIVHTGMLIPECRQIYICPDNCLRGVIMTAQEMGALDRISSVMPDEREISNGSLEKITIEGVTDVLHKVKKRPRAVQLFPVCTHHLLGCDMRYIEDEIEKRFPDIDFMECFMDPVCQKLTTTPEQRQRFQMMKALADHPQDEDLSSVTMLGENLRVQESDLTQLLAQEGLELRQVQDCRTYDEYLSLGASFLWLTRSPLSAYGLKKAADLAGRRSLYMPAAIRADEIEAQEKALLEQVYLARGMKEEEAAGRAAERAAVVREKEEERTQELCRETLHAVGDLPVYLDYVGIPRPLGFARFLLEHGFRVQRVIADGISPEEAEDLSFVQAHYPDLEVMSSQAPASLYERERMNIREKVLAIGPKAAYFTGSPYFVNVIEQDGATGFLGVQHILRLMQQAVLQPKNNEIVTGKGLGLPGVWEVSR